jgi:hypothetical protein
MVHGGIKAFGSHAHVFRRACEFNPPVATIGAQTGILVMHDLGGLLLSAIAAAA